MVATSPSDPSDRRLRRFQMLVAKYDSETGLAWARTAALSDLVLDTLTGDRDDAGVRVLSNQLSLAATITLYSGGSCAVAAEHHARLAADLDRVRPGEDLRSELGSARLAHLIAAEICRGDFSAFSVYGRTRDGRDYSTALRLPPI